MISLIGTILICIILAPLIYGVGMILVLVGIVAITPFATEAAMVVVAEAFGPYVLFGAMFLPLVAMIVWLAVRAVWEFANLDKEERAAIVYRKTQALIELGSATAFWVCAGLAILGGLGAISAFFESISTGKALHINMLYGIAIVGLLSTVAYYSHWKWQTQLQKRGARIKSWRDY